MAAIVFPANPLEGDIFQASNGFRYQYHDGAWDAFTLNITESAFNTTDDLLEGSTNLYFKPERVLVATLVGFSTEVGGEVIAGDSVVGALGKLQNQISYHQTLTNNPHAVTAEQVGSPTLQGVGATGVWDIDVSGNASTATKLLTGVTINGTFFDGTENIVVGAADTTVRIPVSEKGVANGVATLDEGGKVPSLQLPSYVDDVLEYTNLAAFPVTGETSKIYISLDNNKTYRWSGSAYVYITSGAVDSVSGKTGIVTLTKADVGLLNVDNTADADKPVSTLQSSAINAAIAASTPVSHIGTGGAAHADVIASGASGFMSGVDKTKLDNIEANANNYTHPTTDGSHHVPATGTTNNTKVLKAGAVAGSEAWSQVDFSELTGKPTTISGYAITDAVKTTDNLLPLTHGNVSSVTLTTSTTTANQVIDSTSISECRTVKYTVQITSGTAYQSTEIIVLHDGAAAYLTEYSTINTGVVLATFDATVSGGYVRLLTTPVNAVSTIKAIKTVIKN